MILEKIYNFNRSDFDRNGFHKEREFYLFIDFIKDCEKDFYDEFDPYFANALYANGSVLYLLKSCFNSDEDLIFGMEKSDEEIDIEMNLRINEFSENETVYGLASSIEGKEEEPFFLINDNKYSDTQFSLKFIPDEDDDGGNELEFSPDPADKISEIVC